MKHSQIAFSQSCLPYLRIDLLQVAISKDVLFLSVHRMSTCDCISPLQLPPTTNYTQYIHPSILHTVWANRDPPRAALPGPTMD